MNQTDLFYFCLLVEEQSFTKASQKLYISQQALSSRIARLEKRYKVTLIKRENPLRLTEAGKVFYDAAQQILGTLDRCDRVIQEIADSTKGSLSVGIPVSRGTIMLPKLCTEFHRNYPLIHLEIYEGATTAQVEEMLRAGKLDLSIGYLPSDTTNIISHLLYVEEYELAIPMSLMWEAFSPRQYKEIFSEPQPLSRFAHLPFIIQDTSTKAGENFRKMCQEAGFTPHTVLNTSNILTQINICEAGMGACVAPSTFLHGRDCCTTYEEAQREQAETCQKLALIRLKTNIGTTHLSVNHLKNGILTQAGKEFIQLAESLYRK